MKIKALKLSGFKSFVEPAELKIRDGLTGVVGPNGCGKSNLLEAIRWVMGESSPKSMRGGGMEDVIFAGTSTRPARNFAEVTLNAEVGEDNVSLLNMEGDDLEVIRRIERGAGSAYRANGRDVRAKDIALIFADAATGAHSPALVSQGRISNIIAAKPAQRREMLEEAAGISGLHVRRKDAEQKLRAAERNLERLDTILSDMESRSGHLKRQARAAERYRKLTDAISKAEARLIYVRWKSAKEAADSAKEEAQKANIMVADAQQAHEQIMAEHTKAAQALANDRAQAMTSRDAVRDKSHALITLQGQLERIEDQKTTYEKQSSQIGLDISNEDKLTHDAGDALAALRDELDTISQKIQISDEARPALLRQMDVHEKSSRANEVSLANAIAKHAHAQAEVRVADAALSNANDRLRRSEQARIALIDLANSLEQDMGREGDLIQSKDQMIQKSQTLEKTISEHGKSAAEIDIRLAELDQSYNEKQETYSALNAQYSALLSEQTALRKSIESQKSGADKAISQISADSGFEQALAAALGEDAQAQIGGTQGRRWMQVLRDIIDNKPPISGAICLDDHVKAPAELRPRLRHIWVVEHDDGSALPAGHRIVTRDGIMRRWDGFISDGDGSMAAQYLVRNNRLSALEKSLPDLQIQCDDAQQQIEQCKSDIAGTKEQLAQLREQRKIDEEDYRNSLRNADKYENLLTQLRDKKSQLEEQSKAGKAEYEAAQKAHQEALSEREKLTGSDTLSAKVETLRHESETLRSLLIEAQANLSSHDQNSSAQRERKAVISAEIRGWQERAGEADKRIDAMKNRAVEISKSLLELEGEPERLVKEIEKVQAAKIKAEENLTLNQEREEVSEKLLKTCERSLAEASEHLANVREARATAQAQADNQDQRRVEMGRISGERFECPPPVLPQKLDFDENDVHDTAQESAALEKFQQDRERIGPVNLVAADELAELEKEQIDGRAESEELIQAINQLRGSIGSLNREGRERLRAAFTAVDEHFRRLFSILFNGGAAHLELIDSDDPLEAGLEIMAQPPGKKLSSLTLLSGGEQALTAVALIFGLFLTNPAPICVLDEVDAPLDDANIERFCDLLDAMVKETDTRYLIVTHNAVTMSRMHRLYGVTMIEQGISRLVSVDLGGAAQLLDNV